MEDECNAFMWLRGDARERALHSLNYQSLGMSPWIQQRLEPLAVGNEHDQYHVVSAAALQDIRGGDFLKQQLLHYQQPFQFLQQPGQTSPLLQQQLFQQTDPQQIICSQSQNISENHNVLTQQLQQPHNEQRNLQAQEIQNYAQIFPFQNNCLQRQKSSVPSQLSQNLVFPDSGTHFSSVLTPNFVQSILSDSQTDGANVLNLSRGGRPMSEQNQQPWEPKLTMSQVTPLGRTVLLQSFPEKDGSVEVDNCTADTQNHNVFGVNIDSSSLLSNGVPNLSASAFDTNNVSPAPYAASCIQNSLYNYLDESSGLVQNGEETDPTTRTFVKV